MSGNRKPFHQAGGTIPGHVPRMAGRAERHHINLPNLHYPSSFIEIPQELPANGQTPGHSFFYFFRAMKCPYSSSIKRIPIRCEI